MKSPPLDSEYLSLLKTVKERIRSTQIRAALAVNQQLVQLYWEIGKQIVERQKQTKWGSKLLEMLSHDLQNAFPGMRGFSIPNLKRMRQFAQSYPELQIGSQPVSQLPWGHIAVLLSKVKNQEPRNWYIQKAMQEGWSRLTLEENIQNTLYERQGIPTQKTSNFIERLPSPQSALAQEILKSPYNFDFLSMEGDVQEREIERELTRHITQFLLELGKGFAFLGTQVPLTVNDHEFFLDMLFYHVHLHCYVVVKIKAKAFKPSDAGQLNFYLTAVDRQIKREEDHPTIGILLCRSKDKILAEYALQDIHKPMGISEYHLSKKLPKELKTRFPTVEEIEAELSRGKARKQPSKTSKSL